MLKRLIEANAAEIAGLKDREGILRLQVHELNDEVTINNKVMADKNLEFMELISEVQDTAP